MVASGRQRGRPVKVPDGLVVGWRSSFEPRAVLLLPGQGVLGFQHADAWVDAGRRSLQTGQGKHTVSLDSLLDTSTATHIARHTAGLWYLDCR